MTVKTIEGFPNYTIDVNGTVRNKITGLLIKHNSNGTGYVCVYLFHNRIRKTLLIHRLIAIHFIPNPENKPNINHINAIRTDNRIENLEWCTQKENIMHTKKLNRTNNYKIKVIDTKTNKVYRSKLEASKDSGYCYEYFCKMLNGDYPNMTSFRHLNQIESAA